MYDRGEEDNAIVLGLLGFFLHSMFITVHLCSGCIFNTCYFLLQVVHVVMVYLFHVMFISEGPLCVHCTC